MTSLTSIKSRSLYKQSTKIGFLSLFYACTEFPLNIWEKQIRSGQIRRLTDEDGYPSLQILGLQNFQSYIMAPSFHFGTLGVRLPHVVLILRGIGHLFALEIQILDDTNTRRRFRFCTYQMLIQRHYTSCHLPIRLEAGWNEVSLNLADFTTKIYETNFVECVRIKVYPNCRLRQIYFTATPVNFTRALNILKTGLCGIPKTPTSKKADTDFQVFPSERISSNANNSDPTSSVEETTEYKHAESEPKLEEAE